MFLQVCVILFTGGEYLTRYPPPRDQVHPPGPGTPPRTRYTPRGPGTPPWTRYTPPDQVPPLGPAPPPRTREIRSTCGRYASYWNAFLLMFMFMFVLDHRYPPLSKDQETSMSSLYCSSLSFLSSIF